MMPSSAPNGEDKRQLQVENGQPMAVDLITPSSMPSNESKPQNAADGAEKPIGESFTSTTEAPNKLETDNGGNLALPAPEAQPVSASYPASSKPQVKVSPVSKIPDEYYKKPAPRPSREERLRLKEEERIKEATKPKEAKKGKGKIKSNSAEKDGEPEDFIWICVECKEAESISDPQSILIICEGKCNRPFHDSCAGLKQPLVSDKVWVCADCSKQRHRCGFCQEYGNDNEDVFCCEKKGCGMFFHESCLRMQNVNVRLVEVPTATAAAADEEKKELSDEEAGPTTAPVFTCPAHQCWSCTEEYVPEKQEEEEKTAPAKSKSRGKRRKKKKDAGAFARKKERIFRCLECPIAYHPSCIPPSARFHELALLCHEHAASCKLPDLDMSSSMQGNLEAQAEKKLARKLDKSDSSLHKKRKLEEGETSNLFFPGMKGDGITGDEGRFLERLDDGPDEMDTSVGDLTFCLPCDFADEVHSKPPSYRHVHSLRYNPSNKPKRRPPSGEVCQCKKAGRSECGDDCLNKVLMVSCIGGDEKNPYFNCEVGPLCGNRALAKRQFAKCKPKKEKGKGWGLVSIDGVKKGGLVQEYVGEIVDEKEKERRLEEWAKVHPNDPNFYLMQLDTGWYIDARLEANLSRFINHSCNPNCILRRINVAGYVRIGIFAIKDVAPDQFLCYDYQFDTKHGDKFLCRCGAPNCRGTMKRGKNSALDDSKKSKKDLWNEAKSRYDRDVKFLEEVEKKEAERYSQVDMLVPAAEGPQEVVAAGPQERYNSIVSVQHRVFLWRNAIRGADFASRYYTAKKPKQQKKRAAVPGVVDVFSLIAEKESSG